MPKFNSKSMFLKFLIHLFVLTNLLPICSDLVRKNHVFLKSKITHNLISFIIIFRYDMSFLAAVAAGGTDLDLQTALEFTSDFAFLEMIHRLIVCVFEALCLHRSTGSHPGGATPGKLLLGLRVVSCTQV